MDEATKFVFHTIMKDIFCLFCSLFVLLLVLPLPVSPESQFARGKNKEFVMVCSFHIVSKFLNKYTELDQLRKQFNQQNNVCVLCVCL